MDIGLKLILVAGGMLIMGVVLPFLMVMQTIEATLPLSLISAVSSNVGLILGFIGIGLYVGSRRSRK